MATFTSSLPDNLLQKLDETARKLAVPKNRIMEKALTIYLDQINRAEYVRSYKEAAVDTDIMAIAEEGMQEYMTDLSGTDGAG
jgi:predicted transcriptional regulator